MKLDLSFPSRYHLWAELSRGQLARIFSATDLSESSPAMGETVTVRLILPDLLLPVSLTAEVVWTSTESKTPDLLDLVGSYLKERRAEIARSLAEGPQEAETARTGSLPQGTSPGALA